MRFWKAFIQNSKICAIIIGQDFMDDFINAYPNEFGSSDIIRVTYLDKDSTKQLISNPFRESNMYEGFSNDAVEKIYELTAGNAYFTMDLCSELISYINEKKQGRIVTEYIVNKFLKECWLNPDSSKRKDKAFFESLYNDGNHREWDDDNISLLSAIAADSNVNGWADKKDIIDKYSMIPFCEEKLNHLIYRDVVTEKNGKLHIKVGLFVEWLMTKYINY
jgi:hypothetical protein